MQPEQFQVNDIVSAISTLLDTAENTTERTISVSFNHNVNTNRTTVTVRKERTLVFDPHATERHLAKIRRNGEVGY